MNNRDLTIKRHQQYLGLTLSLKNPSSNAPNKNDIPRSFEGNLNWSIS
jgi:hypothetical protein